MLRNAMECTRQGHRTLLGIEQTYPGHALTCKGKKCEKVIRGDLLPFSSSSISKFSARLLSAGSLRLSKYSAMEVSCEVGMLLGQRHA